MRPIFGACSVRGGSKGGGNLQNLEPTKKRRAVIGYSSSCFACIKILEGALTCEKPVGPELRELMMGLSRRRAAKDVMPLTLKVFDLQQRSARRFGSRDENTDAGGSGETRINEGDCSISGSIGQKHSTLHYSTPICTYQIPPRISPHDLHMQVDSINIDRDDVHLQCISQALIRLRQRVYS